MVWNEQLEEQEKEQNQSLRSSEKEHFLPLCMVLAKSLVKPEWTSWPTQ